MVSRADGPDWCFVSFGRLLLAMELLVQVLQAPALIAPIRRGLQRVVLGQAQQLSGRCHEETGLAFELDLAVAEHLDRRDAVLEQQG